MPDREQRHVDPDLFHPVEKKDHAREKQEMVVARHHVFGAEIEKGDDVHPCDFLNVSLVTQRDGVREGHVGPERQRQSNGDRRCNTAA